jgi:large subunit ribosomal protein L4e
MPKLTKEAKQVQVFSLEGKGKGEIPLPEVFSTEVRPDLIRRAVVSMQSARVQPKTRDPLAGKRTSAISLGVGLDLARVPRVKGGGPGGFVPNVVGGRRAFPGRVEKVFHERINVKERRLAIRSAIAASASKELVKGRGHAVAEGASFPVVVTDEAKSIAKASDFRELLKKLSLWEDAERAKGGIKERSGRGKTRGRRWIKPKSLLLVTDELNPPVRLASRNYVGIDFAEVKSLNVEMLAPGGHGGRLILWTESALKKLDELYA